MGRPRSSPKTRHVKITQQAYEAARIASRFTGESTVGFISRIVEKHAEQSIDEGIEQREVNRAGLRAGPVI